MKHKYVPRQVVNYGNIKVTIEDCREFWGTPSYRVIWFDDEDKLNAAHLKESEIS